jgi:hypothetical protein
MPKPNEAGYQVHHLESVRGQIITRQNKMTADDVKRAVALWHQDSKSTIRTVIGVNDDGLFGSERDNWHPDLPNAFSETLIVIPWIQMLELLKRVPDGATGMLLNSQPHTKQ